MSAVQVLLAARQAGIHLEVRAGQLVARPSSALGDELRTALKEHRERLIELLTHESPPASARHLYWQAFDHTCWTGCQRAHTRCSACAEPLPRSWLCWPWLHPNCRLEQVEGEP